MKTPLYPNYTYCLLFCLQAISQGAELPKLFNNTALNLGGAWDAAGAVPGTSDVMLWNSTFADTASAATALSQMGADLSVQGIKITNVGGTRNQATRFVGFQNTSSANTLTIGAGGIDASTAFQTFYGQSKLTLGASQTWNVANANTNVNPTGSNNGEDIVFIAQAAAVPVNLNGNTLTTTGAGQITITSGYTISNGTINSGNDFFTIQGGSSRVTTINNNVNLIVSSGTLRIQANSGTGGVSMACAAPVTVNGGIFSIRTNTDGLSATQSGNITLNANSGLSFQTDSTGPNNTTGNISVNGATTVRVAGGGNPANGANLTGTLTGSGNITYLNTATGANGYWRLAGDSSGYSGTITLNGASGNRSLRLGTANSGSAAATWNVGDLNVLQVNGVGVQLGKLQGSGTVTNSSTTAAATITVGAGEFSGAITNGTTLPAAVTNVTKTGPGLLRLTGFNNYTGATTVSGGTLVATPDQTGVTAVTVADGATYGALYEGSGPTLITGNVTVGSTTGGTLQFDYGTSGNPLSPLLSVGALTFNGPSTIKIAGSNLTPGTFALADYTGYAGTAVSGLNLVLPTRTAGSLTNSGSQISLTISSSEEVKWNGNLSDNWDIDPDGLGGSGTANWKTTVTNASTRYIQGTSAADSVNFDDTATGTGTVNLTTTLSPTEVVVDNTAKDYTFNGSGKLTGFARLSKKGTGTLTLANTTPNDYSGGTVIEAGTLRLGDGVTAGAGQVAGNIDNSGRLLLNRPDNYDFSNTLSGLGILEKAQAGTMSFPVSTSINGPLAITGGKVRFPAGGSINDAVSGSGELEAAGGTVIISGSAIANTNTGLTTVSNGTLQLSKSASVNAVGGNVAITGTGVLNILADEQIPDTATISALGSSADSIPGTPGKETFANAIVNGSVATTQLILRNNATVTNTGTINQGILGVASNNTANVNAVVMTSPTAILRVAAGSNTSIMNVGAGGITASAGDVQVKFNTAEFDAILNLSGDVTTTGNMSFSNGGYTGTKLNVVRLNGTRTFNIGAGTITTVAPDLANYINSDPAEVVGTLIKNGDGALVLDAACTATHTGGTTINAGAMRVHGNLGGTLLVNANGSIGGFGTIGNTTVNGTVNPGGVNPLTGNLTSSGTVTFTPDSDYVVEIANWAGTTLGTDWDHLTANSLVITATPLNKLVIHPTGTPTGFTETNKTLTIATSTSPITGFDPAAIQIDATGFPGTGTWAVQMSANTIQLVYTAGAVSAYSSWATAEGLTPANNDPTADPDKDGQINLMEFALNSTALSGTSSGKVVGKVGTVGGQQALTITLPVRTGVSFTGTTELTGTADGVLYHIQASDDTGTWNLQVSEVTGADATTIQTGLPALQTGWTYRTFRSPGPITGDPREYMRVVIDPAS
ncbi:beta strand repeat-containing protein [Luteolibacter soli]|uniref:Autotransporter-associated beta strand repeat-containing protein n=1 Tax=Luteolibacter soli TaxID=3135280 RepID=A0ABU9AU56_9BACT